MRRKIVTLLLLTGLLALICLAPAFAAGDGQKLTIALPVTAWPNMILGAAFVGVARKRYLSQPAPIRRVKRRCSLIKPIDRFGFRRRWGWGQQTGMSLTPL